MSRNDEKQSWRTFSTIPSIDVIRRDVKNVLPLLESRGWKPTRLSELAFDGDRSRLQRFLASRRAITIPSAVSLVDLIDEIMRSET